MFSFSVSMSIQREWPIKRWCDRNEAERLRQRETGLACAKYIDSAAYFIFSACFVLFHALDPNWIICFFYLHVLFCGFSKLSESFEAMCRLYVFYQTKKNWRENACNWLQGNKIELLTQFSKSAHTQISEA